MKHSVRYLKLPTSDNSDFTTITSWDGGGHTTEDSSNVTSWYEDNWNIYNVPGSYTFGNEFSVNDDTSQYKGVLYNWFVTTAGKGTYELSSEDNAVDDSICPKGWKLPSHEGSKSWQTLLYTAGNSSNQAAWFNAVTAAPYSLIRIGNYYAPSAGPHDDNYGYYWTNKASGNPTTYSINLLETIYVSPSTSNTKGCGFALRCVNR